MAGGTFIEGSTIELSADGPMRHPYVAYMQMNAMFKSLYRMFIRTFKRRRKIKLF